MSFIHDDLLDKSQCNVMYDEQSGEWRGVVPHDERRMPPNNKKKASHSELAVLGAIVGLLLITWVLW